MGSDDEPSDEDLIVRMRAGDTGAFRILFDRHVGAMSSRARRMIPAHARRRVSVDDVVQEARITAFRRAPEFRSARGESLRVWLLRIVELKAREAVRNQADAAKRAAGREVSHDARAPTASFAAAGPSPSEAAIANEMRDAAHRAMAALPADYAEVMRLTRVDGLSLAEAGASMGRSREAAKKLYARALARFTVLFDRESGERSV